MCVFFFLALDGFTDETLVCDVVCPTLFHCCWESLGDRHNAGQFFYVNDQNDDVQRKVPVTGDL